MKLRIWVRMGSVSPKGQSMKHLTQHDCNAIARQNIGASGPCTHGCRNANAMSCASAPLGFDVAITTNWRPERVWYVIGFEKP